MNKLKRDITVESETESEKEIENKIVSNRVR